MKSWFFRIHSVLQVPHQTKSWILWLLVFPLGFRFLRGQRMHLLKIKIYVVPSACPLWHQLFAAIRKCQKLVIKCNCRGKYLWKSTCLSWTQTHKVNKKGWEVCRCKICHPLAPVLQSCPRQARSLCASHCQPVFQRLIVTDSGKDYIRSTVKSLNLGCG